MLFNLNVLLTGRMAELIEWYTANSGTSKSPRSLRDSMFTGLVCSYSLRELKPACRMSDLFGLEHSLNQKIFLDLLTCVILISMGYWERCATEIWQTMCSCVQDQCFPFSRHIGQVTPIIIYINYVNSGSKC